MEGKTGSQHDWLIDQSITNHHIHDNNVLILKMLG